MRHHHYRFARLAPAPYHRLLRMGGHINGLNRMVTAQHRELFVMFIMLIFFGFGLLWSLSRTYTPEFKPALRAIQHGWADNWSAYSTPPVLVADPVTKPFSIVGSE